MNEWKTRFLVDLHAVQREFDEFKERYRQEYGNASEENAREQA